MASDLHFVQFVLDQIEPDLQMTHRKMFGEYGLYSRGKIVAVICDDQLFVKPTEAGRAHIGAPEMAPPYPGAAPRFLITDGIEDGPWLSELLRVTYAELPEPKKRKKSKRKGEA
jgi:TfoX/Sxy family transcriptional regulator of competence genes